MRNVRNIVLMRPINSMIEFKQIIGRGTRLFEGKDYFTIHDFVKAYQHFSDPEWDGPPQEPETCAQCGEYPCVCEKPEPGPCPICGEDPCVCLAEPCEVCGQVPCVCEKQRKKKIKVKLADGKERDRPAHDGDDVLASRWHADVGGGVYGVALRQAAGFLHQRRGTSHTLERTETRASCWRGWRNRDSATSSLPRCRS